MKKNNIFTRGISMVCIVLLSSCSGNKQTADLYWYQNEVIEQVVDQDSAVYRVQIGIMAASFWLDKKEEDVKKELSLLQESLTHKKKLDIGVEKGTNKIKEVKEAR